MAGERAARLAFIGGGRHATRLLYPCLPTLAEIDLVAVCDLDEGLARATARSFGARRWYTSVDTLLDDEPALDGVIVVGPPPMMAAVGTTVLQQRRLPIFVEKPPAATLPAALRLANSAAAAGAWGMVGFMRRFSVAYRLARRALADAAFGPVSMLDIKFANGAWGDRLGIAHPGQSYLAGQAIHIFDLVRFLAGPPRTVYAQYLERAPDRHGFAVTLTFANGALGTLNLNSLETWDCIHEWVSITGVQHYLTVENMLQVKRYPDPFWDDALSDLDLTDRAFRMTGASWGLTGPTVSELREVIGYRGELREFARCILEGRQPEADLAAGVAAMRLGQAVWESAQQGLPIDLAASSPGVDTRDED